MKRKLLIVVGVALVAATISTLVFYQLISGTMAGNAGRKTPEYPVVTAAKDLPRGTRLTAEDLKVIGWSGEKPSGVYAQPAELAGRVVGRDLRQGEPILDTGLAADGKAAGAGAIPPGMRAVSIHLSEHAGVAKLLENGDRVDVLAADAERRPGNVAARVHTVLQGVMVLDNGRDEDVKERRGAGPVVTLLVEAKDAELLSLADQAGAIRFALRNPLDDSTEQAGGAGWQDVVSKKPAAGSRDRTSAPPARNISQARTTPKSKAASTEQVGRELAAALPELHSRRYEAAPQTSPPTSGVLLAITFAGLGDEALAELSGGLAQRYTGAPVILSAFQPDWDVQKRIHALQETQRLQVFANPSVLAIERTETHFERSSEAGGNKSESSDSGAPAGSCSDRVGVRVGFLPTIGADQRLRIRVTSQVAIPDNERADGAGGCDAALVAMRQWSGEIDLADGQSFWVRGLIDRPGAWDLLRRLFPQRPLEHKRNDELAILVTPKLVTAGKHGKPLSAVLPR